MSYASAFFIRIQCILVLVVLMVIDIGPVPFTAIMALLIVIFRPRWFKKIIESVYGE